MRIPAGTTSFITSVIVLDSTSTTGGRKTGIAYNAPGLTGYYKRSSGSAPVAVSLADITTLGVFTSGGWKPVDDTNTPGLYEFHAPNAALASGATHVDFVFKGATGMVQTELRVELEAASPGGSPRILPGISPLNARKGDTVSATFATLDSTGAAADADSLPTGQLKRNGVVDGAVTVTVSNTGTGDYSAAYDVPAGYAHGDTLEVVISATIGGINTKAPLGCATVVSKMAYSDTVTQGDEERALELDGDQWRERQYAPGDTPGTPTIQDSHLTDAYGNEIANLPARKLARRGVNEV